VAESMYTPLEKYLLSVGVPNLGLPALIEPITELDLLEREFQLGWDRDAGVGELVFHLRMNGVVAIFAPECQHLGRKTL
jgi:hypothetical protein